MTHDNANDAQCWHPFVLVLEGLLIVEVDCHNHLHQDLPVVEVRLVDMAVLLLLHNMLQSHSRTLH